MEILYQLMTYNGYRLFRKLQNRRCSKYNIFCCLQQCVMMHFHLYFIMIFYNCFMLRDCSALAIFTLALIVLTNSTTVTFYVDHEVEQPLDYVEISAIIKVGGESLESTIEDAVKIIKDIENSVNDYCQTYSKSKAECKDNVETSPYSIRPQYEVLKKRPQFAGFVVAHEMLIKVKESPLFGKLVDDLLKKGVSKINSLEWKPLEEVDGEQIAISEGISAAHEMCAKIGMQLDQIVSAEEVTDFGEEEEEQQQKEGEEEEEEQEEQEDKQQPNIKEGIIYYKFVVECHPKKK